MELSYELIRKNEEINEYITRGNNNLKVLGYTDHSQAHACKVADTAAMILKELGYSDREQELAKIAGFMHDIGNSINRHDHAHTGAIMAFQILRDLGMKPEEISIIISAIGNHDEKTGTAVHPVSAALILADKTDVRRNRVQTKDKASFDIHDRVNYATVSANVWVDNDNSCIRMDIELDEDICSLLDYYEIFLDRMLMCKRAAKELGMVFKLTANGSKVS